METYGTGGKWVQEGKDLNQLRERRSKWSEVHKKVMRGGLLSRGIS